MNYNLQSELPEERIIRILPEETRTPRTRDAEASDFVTHCLERWNVMADAEALQRERSIEEVEFNSGKHWGDELRKEREDKDRVIMEINRTPQYLNQVANAQRMARPSILIKPNGNGADEAKARIRQGIVKSIERKSDSESIRDDCFYNVLEKGWSYARVVIEWENERSNRQVARTKRIFDDFCVYCDPSYTEPDKSDAMDWFITSDIPLDVYEATYGELPAAWSDGELKTISNDIKGWIGEKVVRVAEYFYKTREKEKLYALADDPQADGRWEDELGRGKDGRLIGVAYEDGEPVCRESYRTKVFWCLINARQVLEGNKELTGGREYVKGLKRVPIISYVGKRTYVKKKIILAGMVRDAIEPCLASDYWLSAITEMVALGPKAPWIAAYESIAQYREMWDQSNIENYAALYYDAFDTDGNAMPVPFRNFGEPPIRAMQFILEFAEEDLKRVMGIYDRSLGAPGPEHSGIAIARVQEVKDIANFNYVDNFKRSVAYEAKIYNDLIPLIYDAPQVIDIVKPDGKADKATINKEYKDPGTGEKVIHDMKVGEYDIVVEVGPSAATRRENAAMGILEYIKVDPNSAPFVGDLLARNMDTPDKDELEKRLKMRAIAAGVKDEPVDEADVPEQFVRQYRTLTAQLEQMTQMMQQVKQAAETEEQKFQHERELKAMELASQERQVALKIEADLAKQAMSDKSKADMEQLKALLAGVQADIDAFKADGPVEYSLDEEKGELVPTGGAGE